MKIVLDPGEMAVAQLLATLRRTVNQAAGISDRRRDTRDPNVTELMGATAEVAFCKHFNCYPDLTVVPRRGGHDAILRGHRWDIKAVAKPDHRLLAAVEKSPGDVDCYALAVVSGPTVELVGWAPAGKLLHPATVVDLGHGPVHALSRGELQAFPEAVS